MKEVYKNMNAREAVVVFHDDGGEHPDWETLWKRWSDAERISNETAIRPETFKKLAPFGDMLMKITENKQGQRLVAFTGKGVNAFACPLKGYC